MGPSTASSSVRDGVGNGRSHGIQESVGSTVEWALASDRPPQYKPSQDEAHSWRSKIETHVLVSLALECRKLLQRADRPGSFDDGVPSMATFVQLLLQRDASTHRPRVLCALDASVEYDLTG